MRFYESTPVHIPIGLFSLEIEASGEFRFVKANTAFLGLIDSAIADISQLSGMLACLIHPEDRTAFYDAVQDAAQNRAAVFWEGRLKIGKARKYVRIELHPSEIPEAPKLWNGVLQDLTDIQALQARFVYVLDAARAFTWWRDITQSRAEFGVRWAKFEHLEDSVTSISNDDWLSTVHSDDLPKVLAALRALENGEAGQQAALYRRKLANGSWAWFRAHAQISERDEYGTPIALSGVSFEVTAEIEELAHFQSVHKELREELNETRVALERTAYDLTENIPIGTYTMVLRPGEELAKFRFMSRRFLEITGLSAEEARADPLTAFACVHPDDFDSWVQKNAYAFENKLPFREEARLLVNGKESWVVAEAYCRLKDDGTWIWEGAIQDITEQKLAEFALQAANAQLIESETQNARLEERHRLLQDIHDGFGNQLAVGKMRLSRRGSDNIDAVKIIDDCLDDLRLVFASLDAEDDNLSSVLSQILERMNKRTGHLSIALNWDVDAAHKISLEPRPLLNIARIVQEAVTNSLRHANARAISVTVHAENDEFCITIEDDGCGIDMENVTLGRGLRNMRARAMQHGWQMRIDSDTFGTRIRLALSCN
ncbi:MAG: PAS domain-containing protein [Roseinatronobacter sp.]|nr:PAS domain-containing protein [Roseinatronobacter sp.]